MKRFINDFMEYFRLGEPVTRLEIIILATLLGAFLRHIQ